MYTQLLEKKNPRNVLDILIVHRMQYDAYCIIIVRSSELDIWPVIVFQTIMMMPKFHVYWWSNQFSWSVTSPMLICQFLEDKLV